MGSGQRRGGNKTRTDIQSQKFMFKIMQNPHGFRVIDRPPTGAKANNIYYATQILQPLDQAFFLQGRNPHGMQLVVHADNCSVHRSMTTESFKKTRDMVSMPHPLYSPDLALSEFDLFPTVKETLEHTGISDKDQLFEELHIILRSIPREELEMVFEV
jgi:hypothetical protein